MTNDSRRLEACGEALHGKQWRLELAQALGVSERTIRRWAAGSSPVPAGAWTDLEAMLLERAARLKALAGEIKPARPR